MNKYSPLKRSQTINIIAAILLLLTFGVSMFAIIKSKENTDVRSRASGPSPYYVPPAEPTISDSEWNADACSSMAAGGIGREADCSNYNSNRAKCINGQNSEECNIILKQDPPNIIERILNTSIDISIDW